MKRILCVPLDPVHDVGIKLIRNALLEKGYSADLLSPDLPMEEIVRCASQGSYDLMLVSRTLGYGVAELLGRFVDLLDAAGVRERTRIVIGGKPVTPELAAELGFDKGFGEHSAIEDVIAYIEGRTTSASAATVHRVKPDIFHRYSYDMRHRRIGVLLDTITEKTVRWAKKHTSAAIDRVRLREDLHAASTTAERDRIWAKYHTLCDPVIADGNKGTALPKGVRLVLPDELSALRGLMQDHPRVGSGQIRQHDRQPYVFKFLGSGCPILDIVHGKVCERYGMDGFLIINPSWEARYEGLLDGLLTHENDGTITSVQNIRLMREYLDPATLLTVRAHRGLNTPETVFLASLGGADLTKINLVYGALGAGTYPERLTVDGIEAMRIAARANMGFDIPGNDELSGVPAWKSLAGLLVNVSIGVRLGAKPILKPLFCHGPHIVLNGQMKQNYVDYNVAKVRALRAIVDCPIWPGEPIAFMTQTEERVQSANATAWHAAIAATAGVDVITVASTDEAYSRGPIALASRIDAIRAVTESFRYLGDAALSATSAADRFTEELVSKIEHTLEDAARCEHLPHAIHAGVFGTKEDGAYPGTFGRGSVRAK